MQRACVLAVAVIAAAATLGGAAARAEARADLEPGEEEEVLEDYTRPGSKAPPKVEVDGGAGQGTEAETEAEAEAETEAETEAEAEAEAVPKPKPKPNQKPKPKPKPIPKPAAAAAQPVVVWVFGEQVPALERRLIGRSIELAMAPARWLVTEVAPRAQPSDAALAAADRDLETARQLVTELDIPGADQALSRAAARYERDLMALVARDGGLGRLAEIYRLLAINRFLDGDEDGARVLLERCFVLDPRLDFAQGGFPPDMKSLVSEARRQFDASRPGSLSVTAPAGVEVTIAVDGEPAGAAPLARDGLVVGPHYLSYEVAGLAPWTESVIIEADGTTEVAVEPPGSGGPLAVALAAAEPEAGAAHAGPRLRAAAAEAGGAALLLVRARPEGEGLRLTAWLYEEGELVRTASVLLPRRGGEAPGPAAELVRALESEAPALPKPAPAAPPLWRRVVSHKYFWPAVGATAGVITIGVIVGVASSGLSPGEKLVVLGLSF